LTVKGRSTGITRDEYEYEWNGFLHTLNTYAWRKTLHKLQILCRITDEEFVLLHDTFRFHQTGTKSRYPVLHLFQ